MSKKINLAILGATGAVGTTMLKILEEKAFPIDELYLLASERSAGKSIVFRDRQYDVLNVEDFDFAKADIALFSAGAAVSKIYAPKAGHAGCIVIDNTSQFRYEDDIPLVIPEVNPEKIIEYKNRNIIANPNCSTIQMLVALKPIYDAVGIERINIATYQAVSGTGQNAIDELLDETKALLQHESYEPKVYPTQIAFNVLPHIDVFQSNGYTKEEMKMLWETQKIFQDPNIKINPTAVRVPVFCGHAEAIHIETKQRITADKVKTLLANAPGVTLMDEQRDRGYPTPAIDAQGKDPVFVGRIREDISHPKGINLWVVADNLRKGAALNAIQIAERLLQVLY